MFRRRSSRNLQARRRCLRCIIFAALAIAWLLPAGLHAQEEGEAVPPDTLRKLYPVNDEFWLGLELRYPHYAYVGAFAARDIQVFQLDSNRFAVILVPSLHAGATYFSVDVSVYVQLEVFRLVGGVSYSLYGGFPYSVSGRHGNIPPVYTTVTYENRRTAFANDLYVFWGLGARVGDVRLGLGFRQQIDPSLVETHTEDAHYLEPLKRTWTTGPLLLRFTDFTVAVPLSLIF